LIEVNPRAFSGFFSGASMDDTAIGILRGCGLFRALTPESFEKIARIARTVRFGRGQAVFREGDPCPGIYVVGEGTVRIFKIAPSGKEHVLHFARAGMTFAEVAAIGGFDCPAHADVSEASVCALIPRAGFRQIVEEDHGFCIEMMTGMSKWVHQLLIQSDDTRGQGEFTLPIRKKDLASHLNLTSETLSRTLHRLVDCGLIETREQRIRIRELSKLQEVADGLAPAEFT
jgi:CRP/FNR family transcriptional regulator